MESAHRAESVNVESSGPGSLCLQSPQFGESKFGGQLFRFLRRVDFAAVCLVTDFAAFATDFLTTDFAAFAALPIFAATFFVGVRPADFRAGFAVGGAFDASPDLVPTTPPITAPTAAPSG